MDTDPLFDPEDYSVTMPMPHHDEFEAKLLADIKAGTVACPFGEFDTRRDPWIAATSGLAYQEAVRMYRAAAVSARAQFEADMVKEHDMADLPPACRELIHRAAWEEGHSSGYTEVAMYYPALVAIAKAATPPGLAEALYENEHVHIVADGCRTRGRDLWIIADIIKKHNNPPA